jgi:hypothetical protein
MNIKVSLEWKSIDEIRDELRGINQSLAILARALDPTAVRFLFFEVLEDGQLKRLGGKHMFIQVGKARKFAIKPVDAAGNEAKIDGAPEWAVSNPDLAQIEIAEDGLSAMVTAMGAVGEKVLLQVKADGDMSENVRDIFGELELELIAGDAVEVQIAPAD